MSPSQPDALLQIDQLNDWVLTREGIVISPAAGDSFEAEGVLNPAAVLGPDGRLHLYVRVVAEGNFSRIRHFIRTQTPDGWVFERHCIALEPSEPYEFHEGGGGCEDPRVSWFAELELWVMTYTGYGDLARICLAVSSDLEHWERLGPIAYEDSLDVDLNGYSNKDATLFPVPVTGPHGKLCAAFLHRPMWNDRPRPAVSTHAGDSIWISYTQPITELVAKGPSALVNWSGHRQVATPQYGWESVKIGAGAPPVIVPEGFLMVHHGVSLAPNETVGGSHIEYSPGLILLDRDDPSQVVARTARPLLVPRLEEERHGTVPNVIFPTSIVPDGDSFLIYYGAADEYVGQARLHRVAPSAELAA